MPKLDIAVVGEINLDLILYGLPEQMPTERELLASGFTITLGSSSAILAHNLAALGSRVGFVTKVGGDAFGTLALERLRGERMPQDPRRSRFPAPGFESIAADFGDESHMAAQSGKVMRQDGQGSPSNGNGTAGEQLAFPSAFARVDRSRIRSRLISPTTAISSLGMD